MTAGSDSRASVLGLRPILNADLHQVRWTARDALEFSGALARRPTPACARRWWRPNPLEGTATAHGAGYVLSSQHVNSAE